MFEKRKYVYLFHDKENAMNSLLAKKKTRKGSNTDIMFGNFYTTNGNDLHVLKNDRYLMLVLLL